MDAVLERRLAQRAESQLGLVTTAQLLQLGLTRRNVSYCRAQGRLMPVYPGVLRVGGAVLTERSRILAATLATNGVASHRSAACLHGLSDSFRRPEVIVGPTSSVRGGPLVHRSKDLLPIDVESKAGVPTTTAVRTLIDLGSVVSPLALRTALNRGLRDRRVDFDRLVCRFFQLARRGRSGIAPLRALLVDIDPTLEPAESDLESLLLDVLHTHDVPPPVTQWPLELDGHAYRIGVCYPHLKIAIEGDGFGVHSLRDAFEDDRARQNRLVLHGWLVLRFTWRQLCREPADVARQVHAAIRLRAANR